jgi:hypothetical protein
MAESPISGVLKSARTTVSSEAFASAVRSSEETNNLLRAQNSTLSSIASGLGAIRDKVTNLDTSLKGVATQIANESALERQRLAQEQQQERILAQQSLREGKESVIERKIQSALLSPVQKIGNTAQNVLTRLKDFFLTVLGGWLLNQGIETYKAYASDSKEKLVEIRDNVLKTLGVVAGVFATIRFGIGGLIRGVGGLTAKIMAAIGNNLFKKPVLALAGALGIGAVPGGGGKPGSAKPGGAPPSRGGGGVLGAAGKFVTFLSGLMNFQNQEYIDATLAALSFAAKAPGAIGAIGKIAGIAFTADEIAEAFGKNIFGDGRDKIVDEITKPFKEQQEQAKPAAQTKPASQPQTPMVAGQEKPAEKPSGDQNVEQNQSSTPTAASVTPQTPIMGETSTSGESSSASSNYSGMSMDQLKSMLDPTKTGASNPEVFAAASAAREQGKIAGLSGDALERQVLIATVEASKPSTAQISPTASQNLPSTIQGVAPLPPPPTNVVVAPQQPAPTQSLPSSSGVANNVPAIPTGNPDNFYLLYSQVQYNIVHTG